MHEAKKTLLNNSTIINFSKPSSSLFTPQIRALREKKKQSENANKRFSKTAQTILAAANSTVVADADRSAQGLLPSQHRQSGSENPGRGGSILLKEIKGSREGLHPQEALRASSGGICRDWAEHWACEGFEYPSHGITVFHCHKSSYRVDGTPS